MWLNERNEKTAQRLQCVASHMQPMCCIWSWKRRSTIALHQPTCWKWKRTYGAFQLRPANENNATTSHQIRASGILKYVASAVRQADVLQYDSECSFAVWLWGSGADVSSVHPAQSPQYLGRGEEEDWEAKIFPPSGIQPPIWMLSHPVSLTLHGKASEHYHWGPCEDDHLNQSFDLMASRHAVNYLAVLFIVSLTTVQIIIAKQKIAKKGLIISIPKVYVSFVKK